MNPCPAMRSWRLKGLAVALGLSASLTGCTTPESMPAPSPVADPNAPMRVSTARMTTAPADPVGQLFNDGPRQVLTYSVNTDPLAVLFRDPAFVVKLSPPESQTPARISSAPPAPDPTPVSQTSSIPAATNTTVPTVAPTKPEPVVARVAEPQTTAKKIRATTTATNRTAPVASKKDQVPASGALLPEPDETAAATTTVASAAAVAPVAPTANKPPLSNEPVSLNGLTQKSAGWPIAVKPANVFGAKGPDGSAWRGLVYKSPANTPVKAIEPGKVVFAQSLRGYGNVVIVDHGKQYTSIYGYNEAITKKVGDVVRKGETIALVGDTGPLAEQALYFEIRRASVPIDPSLYLAANP